MNRVFCKVKMTEILYGIYYKVKMTEILYGILFLKKKVEIIRVQNCKRSFPFNPGGVF